MVVTPSRFFLLTRFQQSGVTTVRQPARCNIQGSIWGSWAEKTTTCHSSSINCMNSFSLVNHNPNLLLSCIQDLTSRPDDPRKRVRPWKTKRNDSGTKDRLVNDGLIGRWHPYLLGIPGPAGPVLPVSGGFARITGSMHAILGEPVSGRASVHRYLGCAILRRGQDSKNGLPRFWKTDGVVASAIPKPSGAR